MSNSISVRYLGLWLIIPFMSLITHTVFPIPPTLIPFSLSIIILVIYLPLARYSIELKTIKFVTPIILLCVYLIISQPFLNPPFHRFLGALLSFVYILPIVLYGKHIPYKQLSKLINLFINLSVILLIIETIWRFLHPDLHYDQFIGVDSRWIYKYKMSGLMYSDSNGVGIHLIILLFFLYYWGDKVNKKWKWKKVILLILILLTFSRAAWAAAFLGVIYVEFFKGKNAVIFFIITGIGGVLMAIFANTQLVTSDDSFSSKLNIASLIIDYLSKADLGSLLFGTGFFNSYEVLGRYPHNYWMVFLIESGLIGLSLLLSTYIQFFLMIKRPILKILIPFFIVSLSATLTFTPYLYAIIGIIFILENRKIDENRNCTNIAS